MVGALKGRHQSDAEKNICTWHLLSKRKRGCRDKQNARFHGPEYWLLPIEHVVQQLVLANIPMDLSNFII